MRLSGAQGHDSDVLSTEVQVLPVGAAGSAADVNLTNYPLFVVPDMAQNYAPTVATGSGNRTMLPLNAVQLRQIILVPQAAQIVQVTNSFAWWAQLYRGGVLQGALGYRDFSVAATTITPAITAGSVQVVAIASASGLRAGMQVLVDAGASQEQVTLLSVAGSNISAYFAKVHSGGAALTLALSNPAQATTMLPAWGGVAAGATIPAVGATGSQTVTPTAVNGISGMVGIHVGDSILVTDGASTETIVVTAVTATTFTAVYAFTHTGGQAITTTKLFNQTSQAVCVIRGGDVVVMSRISTNATGLASVITAVAADVTISASLSGL